jgi:hypothetical protein
MRVWEGSLLFPTLGSRPRSQSLLGSEGTERREKRREKWERREEEGGRRRGEGERSGGLWDMLTNFVRI